MPDRESSLPTAQDSEKKEGEQPKEDSPPPRPTFKSRLSEFAQTPLGYVTLMALIVLGVAGSLYELQILLGAAVMLILGFGLPIYLGWNKSYRTMFIVVLVIAVATPPVWGAIANNQLFAPYSPPASVDNILQNAQVNPFSYPPHADGTYHFRVNAVRQSTGYNGTWGFMDVGWVGLWVTNCPYDGAGLTNGCGGSPTDYFHNFTYNVPAARQGLPSVPAFFNVTLPSNQIIYYVFTANYTQNTPFATAYDGGKGETFVANQLWNEVGVVSDTSQQYVAGIHVGVNPSGLAYDSAKGEIFVANSNSNNVSVISDTSNQVIGTIPVGSNPYGVVYDSGKGEIFVANAGSDTVSVISDASDKVVATIPVGSGPVGLAYDGAQGEVFVSNSVSGNVSIVSDATNKVVSNVPVGNTPVGMAYDTADGKLFVANEFSNDVSVISNTTGQVVSTVPVGLHPLDAVYDSGLGAVYVSNTGSNTLSVITGATSSVQSSVAVGPTPTGVSYDAGKGEVLVANTGTGNLSIVLDSSQKVIASVAAGAMGWYAFSCLGYCTISHGVAEPYADQDLYWNEGPITGSWGTIYVEKILPSYYEVMAGLSGLLAIVVLVYRFLKIREKRRQSQASASASGTASSGETRCPKCNAVVKEGESFCWKCGTSLEAPPSSESSPALK